MIRSTIAVAIACFNQAHFLDDAIQSVISQTRPPDEIILIDDGSTDATATIGQAYPQVHYLYQPNAGLSAARNKALAATNADFILFLDADDALLPSALLEAETRLASNPDLAFVYGGFDKTNRDGRLLSRHPVVPLSNPFLDLLRGNSIAMHGTVLYRRRLLHASGGFDVGLRSCEDFDVYLRLARTHQVAPYDDIAATYRQHGQGLSARNLVMIATSRAVITRHAQAANRDAAPHASVGLVSMTDYYVLALTASLKEARHDRQLARALGQLFAEARSHPLAALHASWSGVRCITRALAQRLLRR